VFLANENRSNLLPCVFLDGVLCSYRKSTRFTVMDRCLKCRHYRRFVCEMAKEEDEFWSFVDEVQKHPDRYRSGELR
jgi:hypothetical protein